MLDSTLSIIRARLVGGAGSGNTWLAVEKAKRLTKDGQRVGLFFSARLRREVAA
ncbi:hypothetical protein [Arthrobacter sp. zg-Y844]|uniref:hypothetical protein n=1 Tax=Arthrobacter sp. zg-Y844 TaxID=2964612 RepID=UPI002106CA96|nr:hypothetical protein [Arthrobacter sp. zg-Y844]MCQ1987534.1 hypothetical protein [Arthrobacter sp. zg-Y844]